MRPFQDVSFFLLECTVMGTVKTYGKGNPPEGGGANSLYIVPLGYMYNRSVICYKGPQWGKNFFQRNNLF